jgi:hypothetical protein
MAEPIIKLTRGVPKTDREWMDVFSKITKHLRVEGDRLIIEPEVELPPSAGTSVLGRASASPGAPADIVAGSDGTFLKRAGSTLAFSQIADGDIPAGIARDAEVATAITTAVDSAITAHEAAGDPHPGYTTAAELSGAISTHSVAADPHSVYPLAAGTETISGAWTFSGEVVLNGANPSARISSAVPLVMFDENAAVANNRKWRVYAYTEQFVIDAVNDAENSVTHALEIDRTGTTIDAVTLLATLIRLAGAVRMDVSTTTTAPSAGAAAALPATPAGYMTINVNGTDRQVPYY